MTAGEGGRVEIERGDETKFGSSPGKERAAGMWKEYGHISTC